MTKSSLGMWWIRIFLSLSLFVVVQKLIRQRFNDSRLNVDYGVLDIFIIWF